MPSLFDHHYWLTVFFFYFNIHRHHYRSTSSTYAGDLSYSLPFFFSLSCSLFLFLYRFEWVDCCDVCCLRRGAMNTNKYILPVPVHLRFSRVMFVTHLDYFVDFSSTSLLSSMDNNSYLLNVGCRQIFQLLQLIIYLMTIAIIYRMQ